MLNEPLQQIMQMRTCDMRITRSLAADKLIDLDREQAEQHVLATRLTNSSRVKG